MSQAEFGRQFGVSGSTILEIENGRLAFPQTLATKISLCYGLDKEQLLNSKDPDHPKLQHLGIEFQKEHYERLSRVNPDEVDERLEMLCFLVKLLGDAAAKKGRFRNVAAELAEVLKAKGQQFGLEDEMLTLLADYGAYPGHPEATRTIYDMLLGAGYVKVNTYAANRDELRKGSKPERVEPQSSPRGKPQKKP
jgi:hypothetical protein